jgi:predicted dehydrogenase
MAEKKLKIGIIGTGSIAGCHINAYINHIKKYGDIEFVAGCDIIPGKARKFLDDSDMFDARDYLSAEEMLEKEELDGVSVCTYNRQHAAPTIAALKHGVNVLVEKPFAVTLDECVEMMRAEKESGKVLTVGFQPRFDPNMQQIKKIVQSGELGRVYYIQTGGGRRRGIPGGTFIRDDTAGVGALGDIGCYSLDMVLNAVGYPTPLTVSGFTTDYIGKDPKAYNGADRFSVDDFSGGLIRLEGDIILDFRISWALNVDTPGDTLILGTKAGLRIPSTDCWNGSPGGAMTLYYQCAGQSVQTTLPVINDPNGGWNGLWDRKIDSFLKAIREGGPAPVPTSQIIKNQAIIDGIMRSAKLGREVEIHIPEI